MNMKPGHFRHRCIQSMIVMLMTFCASAFAGAANVHDVRLWRAPDHTRIVFDLDKPIEHKIFTLDNPGRIVIDISDAVMKKDMNGVDLKDSPIRLIRSGKQGDKDLRVVLDLSSKVKARSFFLSKSGDADDRLVIDLQDVDKAEPVKVTKAATEVTQEKRDLIIAIDAGHGGEDPGALGPNKIREKNVVLAIAKELSTLFGKEQGYKTIMVRTGDYYVGLEQRRDIARDANADMFVSIHADAFSSPKAHGSSVYALSSQGASSASAKFLADKENQSDLIGGVRLKDKDPVLSSVLLSMAMNYKMESSLDVGGNVLSHMGDISRLHSKRVEQAAFAVLKTPDIPSILVETGFISNPEEARKLNSKDYQRKMARAIYNGIHGYFKEKAPEDSYIAWKYSDQNRKSVYIVERGDTLSEIASRYDVSMKDLQSHNRLSSHSLRIGQELQIP